MLYVSVIKLSFGYRIYGRVWNFSSLSFAGMMARCYYEYGSFSNQQSLHSFSRIYFPVGNTEIVSPFKVATPRFSCIHTDLNSPKQNSRVLGHPVFFLNDTIEHYTIFATILVSSY